jgi:hypothetical protein
LCVRGGYSSDERIRGETHELGYFGLGYIFYGEENRVISVVDEVVTAYYDVPTSVSSKVFTANIWGRAQDYAKSVGKHVV